MKHVTLLFLIVLVTACNPSPSGNEADKATGTGMPVVTGEASDDGKPRLPGVHVYQFGIYKAVRKGAVRESSQTNTGKIVRKPKLEHVSMTDRIPLVKDTYFGYQYRLFNLPPAALVKPAMELRKVLIHPKMTLPDGTTTTGWDRTFKGRVEVEQVMGFDGYVFNEDYELVEGDWIFQLWYKDQKLIERKFRAVRPDAGQLAETGPEE